MKKTIIDLISEAVLESVNTPNAPAINTGVVVSPSEGTVVSRQTVDGRTKEMWLPGDPFIDSFYFGGTIVEPTDEYFNTD